MRIKAIVLLAVVAVVVMTSPAASAKPRSHAPKVTTLATLRQRIGIGSTIGPDRADVTDPNAGSVLPWSTGGPAR